MNLRSDAENRPSGVCGPETRSEGTAATTGADPGLWAALSAAAPDPGVLWPRLRELDGEELIRVIRLLDHWRWTVADALTIVVTEARWKGESWRKIGGAVGLSHEGARQRFAP